MRVAVMRSQYKPVREQMIADDLKANKLTDADKSKSKVYQRFQIFADFARKPDADGPLADTAVEQATACPYCAYAVPQSTLSCVNCSNTLPYCVATGYHMSLGRLVAVQQLCIPDATFGGSRPEATGLSNVLYLVRDVRARKDDSRASQVYPTQPATKTAIQRQG